jgi:hypothetical protein
MANRIVAAEIKTTEPAQQLPERETIIVPIMLLKAALSVAAKNDVRYYLNGVLIQSEGRDLRVVGTDGHRLFVAGDREQRDFPAWLAEGFVLNRECLSETLGLLGKLGGGNIAIDWAPGHKKANLRTQDGAASIGIKIVDGKYPAWRSAVERGASVLGNDDRQPLDTATVNAITSKAVAMAAQLDAEYLALRRQGRCGDDVLVRYRLSRPALHHAGEDRAQGERRNYAHDRRRPERQHRRLPRPSHQTGEQPELGQVREAETGTERQDRRR